jgi:ADP-ribose pyrophosphatase YjhB (NUDIX family)
MERQFTATVYIIEQQRTLLILHRKLNKWLPPGGHLDPNETPPEGARREAREETGVEIEFITQENIWIDRWNAKSFERPYLCLIEEIPSFNGAPAHQHIDFIYLAKPVGGIEAQNIREVAGMRWFTMEEIEALKPDEEIFAETQETLRSIFASQLQKKASVMSQSVLECGDLSPLS